MANLFKISPLGSQAGVVTFADDAEMQIPFSKAVDVDAFKKAVSQIPFKGSAKSNVEGGLTVAGSKLIPTANKDLPKMLIMLTEGVPSRAADELSLQLNLGILRNANVTTVVVNVGEDGNRDFLKKIAGSKDNVFAIPYFQTLRSAELANSISKRLCKQGKFPACN